MKDCQLHLIDSHANWATCALLTYRSERIFMQYMVSQSIRGRVRRRLAR